MAAAWWDTIRGVVMSERKGRAVRVGNQLSAIFGSLTIGTYGRGNRSGHYSTIIGLAPIGTLPSVMALVSPLSVRY